MNEKQITSLANPRVKEAVRLRTGRHRTRQGRFLIDGAREITQALAAGVKPLEAFVCEALCVTAESRQAIELLLASGCDAWHVTAPVFAKLAFGERDEGVLLIAETPDCSLARLRPRGQGPIAVLEAIEKPGNVGAVLRSADAAGVAAVILASPVTDLFNPNCIRASLGAVFRVPVAAASTTEVLAWLRDRGRPVFAARVDAELDYTSAAFTGGCTIVLGSEADGLTAEWNAADITAIRLPMLGAVDSLNISATAAVLFYEALRQRRGMADD